MAKTARCLHGNCILQPVKDVVLIPEDLFLLLLLHPPSIALPVGVLIRHRITVVVLWWCPGNGPINNTASSYSMGRFIFNMYDWSWTTIRRRWRGGRAARRPAQRELMSHFQSGWSCTSSSARGRPPRKELFIEIITFLCSKMLIKNRTRCAAVTFNGEATRPGGPDMNMWNGGGCVFVFSFFSRCRRRFLLGTTSDT